MQEKQGVRKAALQRLFLRLIPHVLVAAHRFSMELAGCRGCRGTCRWEPSVQGVRRSALYRVHQTPQLVATWRVWVLGSSGLSATAAPARH